MMGPSENQQQLNTQCCENIVITDLLMYIIVFFFVCVFYRERAAGMYSALPYAFAQVKGS